MGVIKRKKILKAINLILILTIMINIFSEKVSAEKASDGKKVIVFIMDEISLDEIKESNTPNIDKLIETGGIGLMNTRGRSSLSNRGSRYLSLGMGVRTLGSTKARLAFNTDEDWELVENDLKVQDSSVMDIYQLNMGESDNKGEIVNIGQADIIRQAYNITPNNQVGYLGKIARENNLKIGFIGNTDTRNKISRESTLIAIDENGFIPYGSISSNLLREDKKILGGVRLDEDKAYTQFNRIYDKSDIIFIEFGDTSRIERAENITSDEIRIQQKKAAIERGDKFLSRILSRIDNDSTRIIFLSPNTSSKMSSEGNFGLTPIVVSDENMEKGLLTSNTTRQKGLVTNFDFGPTVLSYLAKDIKTEYIGETMEVLSNENPIDKLTENEDSYLYLRKYRKVFHWIYIGLIMINLLISYLPYGLKKLKIFKGVNFDKPIDILNLTIFSIPLTMMTVSIFGYKNIFLDILYVFIGGLILGISINLFNKNTVNTLGILSFLTSIFLIIDTYFIKKLMIISPLGSDAIAGGRFYGIGNDYMGILLGASILFIFTLFKNKDKKILLGISSFYMLLIIVSLSPLVGANMGGTISALSALIISIMLILDKRISFKKLIAIGMVVILLVLLIASLDILFNENPTHAGKAIKALVKDGNGGKLFEIINTKLRQVFWNLAYSPWNIVFFTQVLLSLVIFLKNRRTLYERVDRVTFKSLILILLTSMAIFAFNDTGTIGAALCLTYLYLPLKSILIARNKNQVRP